MKHSIQMLVVALFATITAQAQISFGNFETLNADSTMRYWTLCTQVISIDTSSVPDSIIVDGPLLQYSTNANSGNYALQLQNHWNYTKNIPYMNGCTVLDLDTTHIMYNGIRFIELSNKPTSFNLYYLYQPQNFNDDTSTAIVKFYNSNMEPIGEGEIKMWDVLWTYQLKSIPITYTSTDAVAFYSIDIKVSAKHIGNKLLVDDLAFDFTPLNIKDITSDINSFIYPNPATSVLNIYGNHFDKVEVMNQFGQNFILSFYSNKIDVSYLPNGIYFIKLINEDSFEIGKFVKN